MSSEPWPRCPEAAAYFSSLLSAFCAKNPPVARLAMRLEQEGGVDLHALVDHWILPVSPGLEEKLLALGLEKTVTPEGDEVFAHPGARLPRVRIKDKPAPILALGVENIAEFCEKQNLPLSALHGPDDSAYQCGHVSLPHGELMPIARRGYTGFAPSHPAPENLDAVRQSFTTRPRAGDELAVIAEAKKRVESAAHTLGLGRATDEFFAAERDYYLTRNAAARWQLSRQVDLGIGWANHDHHTYRSSRAAFKALIQLFVSMGFVCRERFYAGAEAGWGAQVLEHPKSRVVIFADVDIAPEELDLDFSESQLTERNTLGTIGLWCGLHGSSIAEAGMHHIECEFLCQKVKSDAIAAGFPVMNPFTELPMLWQAFTQGEIWQVSEEKIKNLVSAGLITREQSEKFQQNGALGSHLEILQRWEGFKGFNKTAVSNIIRDTDARRN